MTERLQKVLAQAGVASRRSAERLIVEGRVSVNGAVTVVLGTKIDPEHDVVRVDGKPIPRRPVVKTYILLNKPRGYVTTLRDPEGRPTVRDLLRGVRARVFPVGRLDYDSEGLLLLTDDGNLARDLMHPSSGVSKTYLVKVRGEPAPETLRSLESGIPIGGRRTLPARVRISRRGDNCWLEVDLVEGRNRQVRRMLEAVGHPVMRLRRVGYGGLTLGNLVAGRFRSLTPGELQRLRRAIGRKSPVIR